MITFRIVNMCNVVVEIKTTIFKVLDSLSKYMFYSFERRIRLILIIFDSE